MTGNRSILNSHPKQILISSMVVNFIAHDLIPLSIVESDIFVHFFQDRSTFHPLQVVHKLLPEKVSSLRNDVKRQLALAQNVCRAP